MTNVSLCGMISAAVTKKKEEDITLAVSYVTKLIQMKHLSLILILFTH